MTAYLFEDIKKRVDLALIWIFSNYVHLKQAYFKRDSIETIRYKLEHGMSVNDEQEDIIEMQTEQQLERKFQEANDEICKYEYEYDKTLNTVLFNLQQRPEQKDL